MNTNHYQLSLTFYQILSLVKQLPNPYKVRLNQELEKEITHHQSTDSQATAEMDDLKLYYQDSVLVVESVVGL